MYARTTTLQVSPYRLDEAIGVIENEVVPAAQKQHGFKGLLMLVDRGMGQSVVITLWEAEVDRDVTGAESIYYREALGKVVPFLMGAPAVEDLEIAIQL